MKRPHHGLMLGATLAGIIIALCLVNAGGRNESAAAHAKSAEHHFRMYTIWMILQEPEAALSELTKSIEEDPGNAMYYSHRAGQYMDLHDYKSAISDSTRAINLNASRADFFAQRANCHYRLKEYESAARDLSDAIRLSGDNGIYWYQRYLVYEAAGKHDLAEADRASARQRGVLEADFLTPKELFAQSRQ